MSRDVTPAALTPTSGLPVLPAEPVPMPVRTARRWLGRGPRKVRPVDAIDFYAKCPGCGVTAKWHEERVGTRVDITIECRICARRARMRLAASA